VCNFVDSDSYHSKVKEKLPTKSWEKERMQEWFKLHDIPYEEYIFKKDLTDIINSEKWKCDGYRI
jgi:hypothetical protein